MVCTTLQIALFVALAGGAAAQSANRVAVPSLSLRPLFEGGTTAWRTGGTSVVHQSIIRLTSDVQHQRGWLTSSEKAQVGDAWEVDFTFRVTGQAEQFFGDGLALWYTERPLQQGPGAWAAGARHPPAPAAATRVRRSPRPLCAVFGAKDNFKGACPTCSHRPPRIAGLARLRASPNSSQASASSSTLTTTGTAATPTATRTFPPCSTTAAAATSSTTTPSPAPRQTSAATRVRACPASGRLARPAAAN